MCHIPCHGLVLVALGCCVAALVAVVASMVMNLLLWSMKSFLSVKTFACVMEAACPDVELSVDSRLIV